MVWCGVVWRFNPPPPFPFSPSPLLSCVCSDIEYVAQRWSMLTQHEEVPKAQPLNSYGSRTDRAALRLSVIDSYGGRCAVCPYASDCRVRLCVWVCGFVGLWVCVYVLPIDSIPSQGCVLSKNSKAFWAGQDTSMRIGIDLVTDGDGKFETDFEEVRQ